MWVLRRFDLDIGEHRHCHRMSLLSAIFTAERVRSNSTGAAGGNNCTFAYTRAFARRDAVAALDAIAALDATVALIGNRNRKTGRSAEQ